jgi:hypothetical protein
MVEWEDIKSYNKKTGKNGDWKSRIPKGIEHAERAQDGGFVKRIRANPSFSAKDEVTGI